MSEADSRDLHLGGHAEAAVAAFAAASPTEVAAAAQSDQRLPPDETTVGLKRGQYTARTRSA